MAATRACPQDQRSHAAQCKNPASHSFSGTFAHHRRVRNGAVTTGTVPTSYAWSEKFRDGGYAPKWPMYLCSIIPKGWFRRSQLARPGVALVETLSLQVRGPPLRRADGGRIGGDGSRQGLANARSASHVVHTSRDLSQGIAKLGPKPVLSGTLRSTARVRARHRLEAWTVTWQPDAPSSQAAAAEPWKRRPTGRAGSAFGDGRQRDMDGRSEGRICTTPRGASVRGRDVWTGIGPDGRVTVQCSLDGAGLSRGGDIDRPRHGREA